MFKGLLAGPSLLALLSMTPLPLLSFHTQSAAFLMYPIALASPTSWDPSWKSGFTFTASCNGGSPAKCWLQWLSLTVERVSKSLSCILDSKSRTLWLKLPSSACWGWKLAPFLNYVFINFSVLLKPRKALSPFTGRRVSWVGSCLQSSLCIPFGIKL